MNTGLQVTADENMHYKCKNYLLTDSVENQELKDQSHVTEENVFDVSSNI